MQLQNNVVAQLPLTKININQPQPTTTTTNNNAHFGEMLKDAINEVNHLQNQSDIATEKLARGENVELHNVMIAAQKASISLQATLEIRNKVVEAYQEVMRMQV